MTNEEKSIQLATDSKGNIQSFAHMAALEMAAWKDEQFIETAQEDAGNYVKGVAKANPDLSACVLKLLETAYIAGRNRIK